MYERGMTTGSNVTNRQSAAPNVEFSHALAASQEELLYDPQTNGGLLFALPEREADMLVDRLRDAGVVTATRIGTAVEYDRGPHLQIR